MLDPERQRPFPGEFGRGTIMRIALLVHEAVVGVIAEGFGDLALRFSPPSNLFTASGVHQSSRLAKCACSGTLTSAGLATV